MRTGWERPFAGIKVKSKDQWSEDEDTGDKDKIMKWNQNCKNGYNRINPTQSNKNGFWEDNIE